MTKTKILITYNKLKKVIESEVLTPIQTGRANAKKIFANMIGDNTGDNLSNQNSEFCELSAIYWAWKNYAKLNNPDYIGFMHYRRHFIFNKKHYEHNRGEFPQFDILNQAYLDECCINDKDINSELEGCDAIIPMAMDFELGLDNIYDQYKSYHYIEDFDTALNILAEKYPQYSPHVEKYKNAKEGYFLNMFIFKKEIFFEYCAWMFDILFEVQKRLDTSAYDSYQARQVGFIAERLTGIFIIKLLSDSNLKIKELPVSFVKDTDLFDFFKDYFTYLRYKLKTIFTSYEKREHYKKKLEMVKLRIDGNETAKTI